MANAKKSKKKIVLKKSTEEKINKKLNFKQDLFCQHYSGMWGRLYLGNGLQSYATAYGLNLSKKNAVDAAKANAYRLLTNDYILARIRQLMKEQKLTEEDVDTELEFLIKQGIDYTNKLGAIKEYNKLKQRITDKVKHFGSIELKQITGTIIKKDGDRVSNKN